jgi:hypothetical protein
MNTIEVAQKDWVRTLDQFSTIHEGWLVSLDVMGPELGFQPQIRDLPLCGVTAETNRPEATITIDAARADGEHISHVIHSPTHVRIERTNEGADVALEIESADGMAALLRFKTVALPETVDDIPRRR